MDTKILEDVGFTKGEIRVYLSLLELGESTTGPIIEKSGITGSKVYEILDKLIKKGLVGYVIKEKTKYFQAASPKRLLDYVNKREKEMNMQKKEIESIIPKLESLTKIKKDIQSSTVFEGFEGFKTVFNDILDSLQKGEEYYAYAIGEQQYTKEFSSFIMNYHKKREVKGIKVKLLAHMYVKDIVLKSIKRYKHMQIKFTNEHSPTGTLIYKDNVLILNWKDSTVFLIHSKSIAEEYKKHFLDIWGRS